VSSSRRTYRAAHHQGIPATVDEGQPEPAGTVFDPAGVGMRLPNMAWSPP
jgi:hypothetical protein